MRHVCDERVNANGVGVPRGRGGESLSGRAGRRQVSLGNQMVSLGDEMDELLSRAPASAVGASLLLAARKPHLPSRVIKMAAMIKKTSGRVEGSRVEGSMMQMASVLTRHRTGGARQDGRKRRA
jgi:hypothetical protein